jgi:VWFA-related protein
MTTNLSYNVANISCNATTYTTSTIVFETVHPTTVNQRVDQYSVEVVARMAGGAVVYDQTFSVAFTDPTVQAAVVQAQNMLMAAGAASFTGPTQTSSATVFLNTTSSTVQDNQTTSYVAHTRSYIGPQVINTGALPACPGCSLDTASPNYPNCASTSLFAATPQQFTIVPGGVDYETLIASQIDTYQTTTITDTYLTTQKYELIGYADTMTVTINQVSLDSCPVVRSYVSVSDRNGDPVTGLTSANFTVNEDSIARTPVSVTVGGSASISVAMALDYSGSMSGESRTNLQTAATTFINQLGASDAMEIIKFSAAVEAVQTFTTDKALLASAVTNTWSGANGSTAFYDAVYKALTDTSARSGRKAVIAMTDGLDTASTHSIAQVITYAASLGIPVYTIGLGSADNTVLSQLAGSTSGHYYNAPTSADLQSIYTQIANVIQNQYEVTYASALTDGAQHTLQITVTTAAAIGSATRQFTACSPASGSFLLSVSLTGTGSGSVHSSSTTVGVPGDISCTTGTCSVVYPSGNIVNLGATPDSSSTFDGWSGWSGACATTPCSVTMNAARNVSAAFTLAPMAKNATTNTPYSTLAAALSTALPGAEIRVLDVHHGGPVSLDKAINLKGGWDARYQGKSGVSSTLDGDFTVLGGNSTVEAVDVKGKLSVISGSLVVNGVKVQP